MSDAPQPEALEPWRQVHRIFVATLKALLFDDARLKASLQGKTLEQMVNQLLAELCTNQGVEVSSFFASFEKDRPAQRQLESVMRVLLQSPAVMEQRRPALIADIKRELTLLEFALSGEEPPGGIWEGIEPSEQLRIRHAASTMRGTDPVMLARVRKALGRGESFGTCEACGQVIPVGRLQLVAAAERCAPCQAKVDGSEAPPPATIAVTRFHPRTPGAPARDGA